jgi:hypothetical protein
MNMKKIISIAIVAFSAALLLGSCAREQLDTDQFVTEKVALNVYGPQPVVRGGELRFIGSNLEKVTSIEIPGVPAITDITVVKSGVPSEIRITVPKDGPEPGYVVLTASDGTKITTTTQISYSEPISIDSFSPTTALPGETITIKGDYLNLIHEVIFTKNMIVSEKDFTAHDRYTIKVVVPEEAQTGVLGLGTIDETAIGEMDEAAAEALLKSLNIIETEEELTVKTSTGKVVKDSYKAGETVTITGSDLHLAKAVLLEGATVSEFTVSGGKLNFVLPATAKDGEVSLEMGSAVTVPVGSITTVVPTGLAAAPSPVKNGAELTITGKDLDLVTGVDLQNAGGVEFTNEGQIVLTVPEAAQTGDAVLHMENGKTVTVAYTLVVPTVTSFSENPASAGSAITVYGTDLDLVRSVTFSGGINVDVEIEADAFSVAVPTAAETGVFVLNLKNATSVETIELAIDKPAGAYIPVFPEEMYAPGQMFIVDIENPEHLTDVQVDGTSVTYILNGNTLYLSIPEEARRGSQITLVSDNGSVTYTMNIDPGDIIETTLWTGSLEIAGWANNEMRDNQIFTGIEMKAGQTIRFYGTFADWWCIQMFDGHWGEMSTGYNDEKHHMVSARVVPEAKEQGFFALTLTNDMIMKLQTFIDWGYWGIIQGEGITLTKITYYEDNSDGTEVWAGPVELTWSDGGRAAVPMAAFQVAKAGQKLRLFYTQKDQTWGQAQVNDGEWKVLDISASGIPNPIVPTDIYGWFSDGVLDRCTEITLTQELLDHILARPTDYEGVTCGVIIQGSDLIFNKITIK